MSSFAEVRSDGRTKDYLNPSSYDSASARVWLPYFTSHYGREILAIVLIILAAGADFLISAAWEEALSTALILAFLVFVGIGPTEVSREAKKYSSRGEPLPQSFTELRDWFSSAFGLMGIASGVGLAIVIYGWSNPPQPLFRELPLTQVLAFVTNVGIMSSASAWSWSYALKRISRGKFGGLEGGLVVLVPLGLISFATAAISITSGLAHWQDSICTYLPGAAISFYTVMISLPKGFISPGSFRNSVKKLEVRKSELEISVQWLTTQEGRGNTDLKNRLQDVKRELDTVDEALVQGKKALSEYESLVAKIIRSIAAYEVRREERNRILSTGSSGEALGPDLRSRMNEALSKIGRAPTKVPKPFPDTRQFKFYKEYTTVFDFPLVLQSHRYYQPMVTVPDALKLAEELDRSTVEEYAPASFEYFLRNYEALETLWVWEHVSTKSAAKHSVLFVRDCKAAFQEFVRVTSERIERFERVTEKDPKSQYHDIMSSVQGSGPSLSTGKLIAETKLEIVSAAYSLVEPYLEQLGLAS